MPDEVLQADVLAILDGNPATEVSTPEASPPATAPEAKPAVDLTASRNLAARAAKEREYQQQSLASKRAAEEAEAYRKEAEEARELKRLAKEDRLGLLEKLNLKYEDIGTDLLTGKRPGPTEALQAKLEALEARLAEKEKAEEERQIEADFNASRQDVQSLISQKADDYEYINTSKHYDMVFDLVQSHFHETGEIDVDWAAQRVEAYLESVASELVKAKKFSKFIPREAPGQPVTRTLTNHQSTAVPSRNDAPMTDEERFNLAVSLLEG